MKNVYVIFCQTTNIDGSIASGIETFAYVDRQKAFDVCNKLNRMFQSLDSNYIAYVSRPLLLDESEGPA